MLAQMRAATIELHIYKIRIYMHRAILIDKHFEFGRFTTSVHFQSFSALFYLFLLSVALSNSPLCNETVSVVRKYLPVI